jgi:5-methylcytosine-specific restriction endonuclease McrA
MSDMGGSAPRQDDLEVNVQPIIDAVPEMSIEWGCQHPNHPYFPDRCLFPSSSRAARRTEDIAAGIERTRERDSNGVWSGNERIETMNSAATPLADSPASIVIDMNQMRARRGTTNRNDRGNAKDRERRRAWLIETYRADVDVIDIRWIGGGQLTEDVSIPACRCYRCGTLLTVDTVTVDRIIPGCRGGTYRRNNIRPACSSCNSMTGSTTRKR